MQSGQENKTPAKRDIRLLKAEEYLNLADENLESNPSLSLAYFEKIIKADIIKPIEFRVEAHLGIARIHFATDVMNASAIIAKNLQLAHKFDPILKLDSGLELNPTNCRHILRVFQDLIDNATKLEASISFLDVFRHAYYFVQSLKAYPHHFQTWHNLTSRSLHRDEISQDFILDCLKNVYKYVDMTTEEVAHLIRAQEIKTAALKCLNLGRDALKKLKYSLAISFFDRYIKSTPDLPERYASALASIQKKLKPYHDGNHALFSMDLHLLLAQLYSSANDVENTIANLNLGFSYGIREGCIIHKPAHVQFISSCYNDTQNKLIRQVSTTPENNLKLERMKKAVEDQKQVPASTYFERSQFLISLNQPQLAISDTSFGLWLIYTELDTTPNCLEEVDYRYSNLVNYLMMHTMDMLKSNQFEQLYSYNLQVINALEGLIGIEDDKEDDTDTIVANLQIRHYIKEGEFSQAQDSINDMVLDIAECHTYFPTEAQKLSFMRCFYLLTMEYLIQKGDMAKGAEALRYYHAATNVDSLHGVFESALKKKIFFAQKPESHDQRVLHQGTRFFLKGLLAYYGDNKDKMEGNKILDFFLKGFVESICTDPSHDTPTEVASVFERTQEAAINNMLKTSEFAKHSSEFKKMSLYTSEKERGQFHHQRANSLKAIGKFDLALNDYAFAHWFETVERVSPSKTSAIEFGNFCACSLSQVLFCLEKDKLKRLKEYTHVAAQLINELILRSSSTPDTEFDNQTTKIKKFIRDRNFILANQKIHSIINQLTAEKLKPPLREGRESFIHIIYRYVIENLLFKGDEVKNEIDVMMKDGKEIKADSPKRKKLFLFYETALEITSFAKEYQALIEAKLKNAQDYFIQYEKSSIKEHKENKLVPLITVESQAVTQALFTKKLKQKKPSQIRVEKKEEQKEEKKEEDDERIEPISLVKGHSLPEEAIHCLEKLEIHGALRGRAYAVGGMVCETLKPTLSKNPDTDIDLVFGTTENPEEVIKKAFSDCKITSRKDKDSWSFKVILPNLTKVDIWHSTALAKDTLTDEEALLEDAKDRDFTMNALYKNSKNELFDPTKRGVKHLTKGKNGIIRSIVSTDLSFKSDPIRILRAIYFNTKRGSTFTLPMQKTICQIAKESFSNLVKEQPGKLNSWLLKLFSKHYGSSNLLLMEKLNVLSTILPEVVQLLNDAKYKKIMDDTFLEWTHLRPNLNRIYAFLIVLISNSTQKSWGDVRKNNPLFEVNFTGLDERASELNKVPGAKFWNTQNYKDEAIKKWGNRFINAPSKGSSTVLFSHAPSFIIARNGQQFEDRHSTPF